MAPVTTTGLSVRSRHSRAKAVSSIVSVPWTTTAPASPSSRRSCTSRASATTSSSVSEAEGIRNGESVSNSAISRIPSTASTRSSAERLGTIGSPGAERVIAMVPPVEIRNRRAGAVMAVPP